MTLLDRFLSYVDDSGGPDACHIWTGPRFRQGYGRFFVRGVGVGAHRWLLGFARGVALRSDDECREMACHTCDNPPCVNLRHLYVGDARSNVEDAVRRGRHYTAREALKDTCKNGHSLDESNVYRHPDNGSRQCRTCRMLRQRKPGAVRMADRTHCPQGHPYTEENTRVRNRNGRTSRDCRECARIRERKSRRRRAA